jgi:hypothetical protein
MARYRIVTDEYAGYEAQCWRWWWPFWTQCGPLGNTHFSVEEAENYIRIKRKREVVKLI